MGMRLSGWSSSAVMKLRIDVMDSVLEPDVLREFVEDRIHEYFDGNGAVKRYEVKDVVQKSRCTNIFMEIEFYGCALSDIDKEIHELTEYLKSEIEKMANISKYAKYFNICD